MMSDKKQKLIELLAAGYPDAHAILSSFDAGRGVAVLNEADSLGHFIVSEALAVTLDKVDRPTEPLAFPVGLAMQRAASELARLAEHCRQAGIEQLVAAFLAEMRDSKKAAFGKAELEAWVLLRGDSEMRLLMDDLALCLWRHFPKQTAEPGPWVIFREDLLKLGDPARV